LTQFGGIRFLDKKKLMLIETEQIPNKIETSQIKKTQKLKYVYVSKIHNEVNEQILTVTFFSLEKKTVVFRMFFNHKTFITELFAPERRWSNSTLNTLISNWYGKDIAICANQRTEKQICKFFSATVNSYDSMNDFQQDLRKAQLQVRHMRETDKIDEKMKVVGNLPKNFDVWLNEVVMNFSRYIYYKRESKHLIGGYCTSCANQVKFYITKETPCLNVRHNQTGKCPACNKAVTFKAVGRTTRQHDIGTAALIQKTNTGFLIRYFSVHKKYHEHYREPTFSFSELVRHFYDGKDVTSYEYAEFRNTGRIRWCHADDIYCLDVACLYTRNVRQILADADLKYSCIYELAKNIDKFNIRSYIAAYRSYPVYEYLIKLRLYRLVAGNTLRRGTNSANLNLRGKGIQEVIGINRLQLKQMQRLDGTSSHLSLIKSVGGIGVILKDEQVEHFIEWKIDTPRLVELLRYVTPQKIIKHINQNMKYWRQYWDAKNSFQSLPSDFSGHWDDYLQNCALLGYDMKSSFILFPRDLKTRHDEVMNLVDAEKKELFDNAIHSLYEPLYSRFYFVWKGMLIRPPASADEIIAEGHTLHHCVGTGKYIENMAKGKCYILFIRNAKQPDNPFFTMEFRDNKVAQCRGKRNCGMTEDVKKFITTWQKKTCGTAPYKEELFF